MSAARKANDANEKIDYEFWSQMSGWTVAEAAALLLEIDPDRLPEETDDRGRPGWKYRRLFRLLDRAREMEELSSPMTPREFLTWASSNGLKAPEKLEATVRAGMPHRNWRIGLCTSLKYPQYVGPITEFQFRYNKRMNVDIFGTAIEGV